jgi:hypothetical protein
MISQSTTKSEMNTCPECNAQVSIEAESCPKCGYPMKGFSNENIHASYNTTYKDQRPIQQQSNRYNDETDENQITNSKSQTDIFAIIAFASGIAGFAILPIIFVPIGYITAIVSYYRLKENSELKGKGLRITGVIFTTINIFWLQYQYHVGIFH